MLLELSRAQIVTKMNNSLPKTREEVLLNLAKHGVNRNFLESEADKIGLDYDHIRQIDEDFCDRTYKHEKTENS